MHDMFGDPENEPVERGAKIKEARKTNPEKIKKAIDANAKAYTEIAMNDDGYPQKLSALESQMEEDIKKSGLQKEYDQTRIAYLPLIMDLKIGGTTKLYKMPIRIQISPYKVVAKINRNKVEVVEEPDDKKRIKIE